MITSTTSITSDTGEIWVVLPGQEEARTVRVVITEILGAHYRVRDFEGEQEFLILRRGLSDTREGAIQLFREAIESRNEEVSGDIEEAEQAIEELNTDIDDWRAEILKNERLLKSLK